MRYLLLLLLTTPLISLAAAKATPAPSHHKPIIITCPSAKAFKKNQQTLHWSATGGWQGYQKSFATKLGAFLGAQWQGVAIGQITCLYQPANKFTFPISIYYNKIVFEPKGQYWGKNKGGYRDCASKNPANCAFVVRPKKKGGDPYQDLTQFKANHHTKLQQGF